MWRKSVGKKIIPTVFCLTSSTHTRHLPVSVIADKSLSTDEKGKITNCELRRAYKLITDPGIPEEVRAVAKETFLFAHVILDGDRKPVDLTPIDAPWEGANKAEWDAARVAKKTNPKPEKPPILNWRRWLHNHHMTTEQNELLRIWGSTQPSSSKALIAINRIVECSILQSEELDLSDLGLTSLPKNILGILPHIKRINLKGNCLTSMPIHLLSIPIIIL